MKKTVENFAAKRNRAFTLIELLVVIAIITMLLAILVPGMQKLRSVSRKLSQKSLFHAIEISLELFAKDFGDYPDSERTPRLPPPTPPAAPYYCGAQHLAEAMVGRDGRGYEPVQYGKWTWPGQEPNDDTTYKLYWSSDISLNRRKETYINLKDTGAYDPSEIYDNVSSEVYSDPGWTGAEEGEFSLRGPVLTDVFLKKKITLAGGGTFKIGSPIMYFKANRTSKALREFKKDGPVSGDNTNNWTYNYKDNRYMFGLPSLRDLRDSKMHHYDADYTDAITDDKGYTEFYQAITDPKSPFDKPFNAATFILMSAGEDTVFGTKDDVTNFNY